MRLLPSRPEEVKFLTAAQKEVLNAALAEENSRKFEFSQWRTWTHPRVWHLVLISFTYQTAAYPILFWMPQAVKSLSKTYSNSLFGILVMIPHPVGLLVSIVNSRHSDWKLERLYHAAVPVVFGGAALILLGVTRRRFQWSPPL